jgi:hypothetical protein
MFVDEEEINQAGRGYDGMRELFTKKYKLLKPDIDAFVFEKYEPICSINNGAAPGSHRVVIANEKNVSFGILKVICDAIDSYDLQTWGKVATFFEDGVTESLCAFISNELLGRVEGRLPSDKHSYLCASGLLKRGPVPHRTLRAIAKKFNENGYHFHVEITPDEKGRNATACGGIRFVLEENKAAAEKQLEQINKAKAAIEKRKRPPKKQKEDSYNFSRDDIYQLINFIQKDLKDYFSDKFKFDQYDPVRFWPQAGPLTNSYKMLRAYMLMSYHDMTHQLRRRRRQGEWQMIMNRWRKTPQKRKEALTKELSNATTIIRYFDEEAKSTKKHLTKILT